MTMISTHSRSTHDIGVLQMRAEPGYSNTGSDDFAAALRAKMRAADTADSGGQAAEKLQNSREKPAAQTRNDSAEKDLRSAQGRNTFPLLRPGTDKQKSADALSDKTLSDEAVSDEAVCDEAVSDETSAGNLDSKSGDSSLALQPATSNPESAAALALQTQTSAAPASAAPVPQTAPLQEFSTTLAALTGSDIHTAADSQAPALDTPASAESASSVFQTGTAAASEPTLAAVADSETSTANPLPDSAAIVSAEKTPAASHAAAQVADKTTTQKLSSSALAEAADSSVAGNTKNTHEQRASAPADPTTTPAPNAQTTADNTALPVANSTQDVNTDSTQGDDTAAEQLVSASQHTDTSAQQGLVTLLQPDTANPAAELTAGTDAAGKDLQSGGKSLPLNVPPATGKMAVDRFFPESFSVEPQSTATDPATIAQRSNHADLLMSELGISSTAALPSTTSTTAPAPTTGALNPALSALLSPAAAASDNRALPYQAGSVGTPQLDSAQTAGSDPWLQELGTNVHWMRDARASSAQLHLHPAELGAVEIRIVTKDDTTSVSFVTHTAAARDIIENSMPRLKEMLGEQGLLLGHSDVSQQSAENAQRNFLQQQARTPMQGHADPLQEQSSGSTRVRLPGTNQIDHYV